MTAPSAAAPAFAPSHPDSRLAADWLFLHAQVPANQMACAAQLWRSGQLAGHARQPAARSGLAGRFAPTPDNAPDAALAARLDDALRNGSRWLYLHLMDEEDLVIPVLALESESWRANTASPLI